MFSIFKKKHVYAVIFNLGNSHLVPRHEYDDRDNHEKYFMAVDEADALAQFWRKAVECNRKHCLIVDVKKI